jgi:hypothetical protein
VLKIVLHCDIIGKTDRALSLCSPVNSLSDKNCTYVPYNITPPAEMFCCGLAFCVSKKKLKDNVRKYLTAEL